MEESEKMEALKKAYADIILNTAKESAARIMVSERKALHFQQDLFFAKEEAINMLLRVKQMMDSKIADMEMASSSQRLKIEELEAQLHEAEDVVTDLRAQLKGVQEELENMKKNQIQLLDEQTVKRSAASCENASQVNKLNTSEAILLPPLDSGPEPVSTYDMKDKFSNQKKIGDNCCSLPENAKPTEPSGESPAENFCAGNPDFASIIMTSKEPELYRNGCTQRIRAFERNLLNGKAPLPTQTDDQDSNLQNVSSIRGNETGEVTCTVVSYKENNIGLAEKKQPDLEEVLRQYCISDKGQDAKLFRRFSSRKRTARYRNAIVTSCPDQAMQACEASTLSHCETYPCPGNSLIESGEDLPRITEEEVQKKDSHLPPVSSLDKTDVDNLSGCMDDTGNETEVIKDVNDQNAAAGDTALIDESEFSKKNSEVADCLGVPTCKLNFETVDVAMISNTKDENTCKPTNEAATQAANDRFLKYTFRRKRKKGSLSCPDENACQEKNIVKRRSGEKQIGVLEPHKSSLIMESSRDSRRLVQVARQLISLSEKRWWQ